MAFEIPQSTPWGTPQDQRTVGPGIVTFGTGSHGGYWLSPDRVKLLPPPLAAIQTFAGGPWYEEDCDWAIVVLAFCEYFEAKKCKNAIEVAYRNSRPPNGGLQTYPPMELWNLDLHSYLTDTRSGAVCLEKARIAGLVYPIERGY